MADTLHFQVWDSDKSATSDFEGEFQVHVSSLLSDIPKGGGDLMKTWKLQNNSNSKHAEKISGFLTAIITILPGI